MNTCKSSGLRRAGIWLAVAAIATSCGGQSDSEKQTSAGGAGGATGGSGGTGGSTGGSGGSTGGSTGTGGATGGAGGTGGSTGGAGGTGGATGGAGGTGGSTGGAGGTGGATGGAAGSGGSTGGAAGSSGAGGSTGGSAGSGGGDAGGCPTYTDFTLGIHITMDVKWAGALATDAGTGKVHLWNRAKLTANGMQLTGTANSCGTVLPDIILNAVGKLAAGGDKVSIEIPFASWDAPGIPSFEQKGTFGGFNPGSAIDMDSTVALVGLTMNDPLNAPWPATYVDITGADAEGDGKLGITGIPKNMMPYVYPPTSLGVFGSAPAADKVYIASRTVLALKGQTTTCDEQAGMVTVKFFDNHVIGCHATSNAECDANQIKFIDDSRTVYVPTGATFVNKKVPDNATCADVRAALP